jgi:hypothetical protein
MCEPSTSVSEIVPFEMYTTIVKALSFYAHGLTSHGCRTEIARLTEEKFLVFLGQDKEDIFQFESDDELLRDIAKT